MVVYFSLPEKTQMHIYVGTHNATDNFHWGTSGWYMYSSLSLSHTHSHTTLTQLIFAKLLVSLMTIYWVLQYYMYLVEHPWCQWEVSAGIMSAYKNGLCPACFSSLLRATSSQESDSTVTTIPFLALVAGVSPSFRRSRCTSSSDKNCYRLKEPVRNQLLLPPYEWVSFSLDL